jgi:lipopolysaccharide transport system ATP-binding protein
MGDIAIRVDGLSKKYEIGALKHRHDTLRDSIVESLRRAVKSRRAGSSAKRTIWALDDVSFEVRRGEVLGVIGHNGAGKSTLLKVLSRITLPSAGSADIFGRVGSLLEVGTGFHPELTGRENVYLNGAILGMKRAEIERKFDAIVDFSGVEQFIDTPVKRYSSGMHVRLAFAVAAHLDPEILIIDEALAVGDAAFQKKCLGKMEDVAKGGRTVLLVTHNMGFISSVATRAVVLQAGRVKFFGDANAAISSYVGEGIATGSVDLRQHPNRAPEMTPALLSARITDEHGQTRDAFTAGDDWFLEIDYRCADHTKLAGAGFNLRTRSGFRVGGFNTYMSFEPPFRIPSAGTVRFCIPRLPLNTGDYRVSVAIGVNPNKLYDQVDDALSFSVVQSDYYRTGYILTPDHGPTVFDGWCKVLPASEGTVHSPQQVIA